MNEHVNCLPPEVVLWGGTGQAKIIRPIVEAAGSSVVAIFDDTPGMQSPFPDVKIHQGQEGFARWIDGRVRERIGFCVAIGNPQGEARLRIHDWLEGQGLRPVTIAHPTAWIAANATIGPGCQISAGVTILPEARLGKQCIVNTHASVDHEDILEEGVEIAPGATLCGLVHVERNAWVGAGATILPRIRIGAEAIVGAGAVVCRDVPPGTTVVGVPAKALRKEE